MKLAKPPTYDGLQRGDIAEMWVQQVEWHFYLQPHLYVNDQRGIAWATSFLQEAAYEWYIPYWKTVGRTDHPATRRWAAFVHAFITHFGDPEAESKAESRIIELKQITSATKYVTEFNVLQAKVQWDKVALISRFKNGLKPEVIRFGSTVGWPRTLEEVKQTAIRIDEGLMEARSHERRQGTYKAQNFRRSQWTPRPTPPQQPMRNPQGNAAEANGAGISPGRPRGKITPKERNKRRRKGLCMYCGGKGHLVAACPIANKRMEGKAAEVANDNQDDHVDPFAGKGPNQ